MSGPPRTLALIPAAGQSTRMGRPKLALPLGRRTVLEHVVHAFTAAGVERILIVLAPHTQELAALAEGAGADVLLLPEPTPDMRATLERGLDWIEKTWQPDPDAGWFLSPADQPALVPAVIRQVRDLWDRAAPADVLVPTFQGRRGHPALVGWNQVAAIRALAPGLGLNRYFRQPGVRVREVPVDCADILIDLDTPEDYERLRRSWPGIT